MNLRFRLLHVMNVRTWVSLAAFPAMHSNHKQRTVSDLFPITWRWLIHQSGCDTLSSSLVCATVSFCFFAIRAAKENDFRMPLKDTSAHGMHKL